MFRARSLHEWLICEARRELAVEARRACTDTQTRLGSPQSAKKEPLGGWTVRHTTLSS
jgi:hypothetical protein